MSLRIVTPPSEFPVALSDAKAHLAIDADETQWDGYLAVLIAAATGWGEAFAQKRYCTQTLEWVLQGLCWQLNLPVSPVQSVTSILYTDENGVQQTLDPPLYIVTPLGGGTVIVPAWGAVWPLVYPSVAPVVIRFTAGVAAADVPANAKHAMLMMVAHFFQNREAVVDGRLNQPVEMPDGAKALMLSEVWN